MIKTGVRLAFQRVTVLEEAGHLRPGLCKLSGLQFCVWVLRGDLHQQAAVRLHSQSSSEQSLRSVCLTPWAELSSLCPPFSVV